MRENMHASSAGKSVRPSRQTLKPFMVQPPCSKQSRHWRSLLRPGIASIQALANPGATTGQGLACSSITHRRYERSSIPPTPSNRLMPACVRSPRPEGHSQVMMQYSNCCIWLYTRLLKSGQCHYEIGSQP